MFRVTARAQVGPVRRNPIGVVGCAWLQKQGLVPHRRRAPACDHVPNRAVAWRDREEESRAIDRRRLSIGIMASICTPGGKEVLNSRPIPSVRTPNRYPNPAFIARFNPNLTLDTSFGPDHTGIIDADLDVNLTDGGWSEVFAIAINPVNQDIVVVGQTAQPGDTYDGAEALAVAEYVSAPTIIQGQMVLPGSLDPNFNGGQPKVLTSDNTVSAGFAVQVLSGGSILIGGGEETMGTPAATQDYDNLYGVAGVLTFVNDFLLVKLTPQGQLDTSFNGTGIAEEPGLPQLPQYTPFDTDPDTEGPAFADWDGTNWAAQTGGIQSLIVLSNGQILAGGYAQRFALDSSGSPLGVGEIDTGFALVRYNSNGTIDTSFGTDGQTFTSSGLFNGTSWGSATLSAMTILSSGDILAAGLADSHADADSYVHVVLAEYDANGNIVTSYGTGGMIKTSYTDDWSLASPFAYGVNEDIAHHVGFLADNAAMAFQPDGELVASLYTSASLWTMVRLNPDGSLGDSFGTGDDGQVTVPVPAPSDGTAWSFMPDSRPSAILITNYGIVSAGTLLSTDPEALDVPLVVRYESSAQPSADDLSVVASSDGSVTLTWTNTGFSEDGFNVERATTLAGLRSDPIIAAIGPDEDDYVDFTAAPDTTYYYQVVPYSTSNAGAEQAGTASNSAYVHTLPASESGYSLQEVLQVPLDGSAVTSSTLLETGQTYLLVASGNVDLTDGLAADANYWYSSTDPQAYGTSAVWDQVPETITSLACSGTTATATIQGDNGYVAGDEVYVSGANQSQYDGLFTITAATSSSFSYTVAAGTPATATGTPQVPALANISYGIGANDATGTPEPSIVPAWGLPNPAQHTYTYAYVGDGDPLIFQWNAGPYPSSSINEEYNNQPLQIEIYALNVPAPAPPSTPSARTASPCCK